MLLCLWVPSVSLGAAKSAAMRCTNTTVATISPASCPLPPGRPKTEGGGRRSRLSHRAGSAHLNQGGYCDGCAEEGEVEVEEEMEVEDEEELGVEVEVVKKEGKGRQIFVLSSILTNVAMTNMMVMLRMNMRLT